MKKNNKFNIVPFNQAQKGRTYYLITFNAKNDNCEDFEALFESKEEACDFLHYELDIIAPSDFMHFSIIDVCEVLITDETDEAAWERSNYTFCAISDYTKTANFHILIFAIFAVTCSSMTHFSLCAALVPWLGSIPGAVFPIKYREVIL